MVPASLRCAFPRRTVDMEKLSQMITAHVMELEVGAMLDLPASPVAHEADLENRGSPYRLPEFSTVGGILPSAEARSLSSHVPHALSP